MRQLAFGCLIGVFSLTASASAGDRGWYVGIEGGVELAGEFSSDGYTSNMAPAVLGTVGHKLGPHFSLEGELGYRSTTEEAYVTIDIDQITVMLNGVYEVPVTDEIALSIGGGIGLDRINVEVSNLGIFYLGPIEDSDIQLAAQVKLGLSLEIGEATDLVADYRVMTTFENDFARIDNSTLTVGLRFAL